MPASWQVATAVGIESTPLTHYPVTLPTAAMPQVTGIDHVYLAVSDLARSRCFYDIVLHEVLGFEPGEAFALNGEAHVHYYNHLFGIVLRAARNAAPHDSYAPGLHHLCLRVDGAEDVKCVAAELNARGIAASPARLYPEYAPDYVATFLTDPDGIRLEVTNYRAERRERHARLKDGKA